GDRLLAAPAEAGAAELRRCANNPGAHRPSQVAVVVRFTTKIMNRENLLFAIIGLLLVFIVGFMFASSMSQRATQTASASQSLPADHPPIGSQNAPDPPAKR